MPLSISSHSLRFLVTLQKPKAIPQRFGTLTVDYIHLFAIWYIFGRFLAENKSDFINNDGDYDWDYYNPVAWIKYFGMHRNAMLPPFTTFLYREAAKHLQEATEAELLAAESGNAASRSGLPSCCLRWW
jgi:hypothetical protein